MIKKQQKEFMKPFVGAVISDLCVLKLRDHRLPQRRLI